MLQKQANVHYKIPHKQEFKIHVKYYELLMQVLTIATISIV